jgi:hypothetical protein
MAIESLKRINPVNAATAVGGGIKPKEIVVRPDQYKKADGTFTQKYGAGSVGRTLVNASDKTGSEGGMVLIRRVGITTMEGNQEHRAEYVAAFGKMDPSYRNSLLQSPAFNSLNSEKQGFLRGCVEGAAFWEELESRPNSGDGFKFLAASYGLTQAQEQAEAKGLVGDARQKFLRSSQDLYTKFSPFGDRQDS